jgi:hypothetical protein
MAVFDHKTTLTIPSALRQAPTRVGMLSLLPTGKAFLLVILANAE